MEEEKKDWVEKFSKDELVDDIQREFATDAQNDIGCGGFLILLLVYNLVNGFITGDWLSQLWSFPVLLLPLFVFEIWWKKRMSKCEDAHQLVDMYAMYNKANKTLGYTVATAWILFMCYDFYSDLGEASMTRIVVFVAFIVIIIGILIWSLFRKRGKRPVEKEIDRLRDMISKE